MSYFYPLPPPQIPLVTVETARRAKLLIDDTQTAPLMDGWTHADNTSLSQNLLRLPEGDEDGILLSNTFLSSKKFQIFESRTKNSVLLYMEV